MPATTAQKNHMSGSLIISLCGFCFLFFKLCQQKTIKFFFSKRERFCYYILVVPKTLKRSFDVLILAITPCRRSARCIQTCSYCIYYCSLPLPSSLLKVPSNAGGGRWIQVFQAPSQLTKSFFKPSSSLELGRIFVFCRFEITTGIYKAS